MNPISDMLIRLKNAQAAGKESVEIPYSAFTHEIAKTLARAGYVGTIERKGKRVRRLLSVTLHYQGRTPAIQAVRLLSKPSRRLYTPHRELKPSRHGGIIILSTPQGVLTSAEARAKKVGGELIAEIW